MNKKAFTLIELLVVIAIIAILAAILFPVFAQAKLAAKKTVVLSNCKQIGLGQLLYINDYDDESPSLGVGDWTDKLYPYVKNEDLFMNPLRNDFDGGCLQNVANGTETPPGAGSDEPGCKYAGFGYNWGPLKRRGGGMLGAQQPDPSRPGSLYIPGISETSITSPADMFNYAVTYDTPRITMGIDFNQCTFTGTTNSAEFFSGQWPVAFADGHAKSIQWKGGFGQSSSEGNRFAVPANLSLIVDYCSDPNIRVDQSGDSCGGGTICSDDGLGSNFPDGGSGLTCAQLPAIFAQFPTGPYVSGAGGATFLPN